MTMNGLAQKHNKMTLARAQTWTARPTVQLANLLGHCDSPTTHSREATSEGRSEEIKKLGGTENSLLSVQTT